LIELSVMLEGQNGLNWERWQRIATAVDDLGFAGLYRSDHYTNSNPPDKDSLELWVSLAWLASNTKRIQFGPLVSPVSFRDPTMTARMASAVDDLSGGRLILGLGAGWQVREHTNFGWELLEVPARFRRFEEGLQVIIQLLQSDEPVDFSGEFYRLKEAILLPRPKRVGGPPILIGGNGRLRTLPLVARFAQEWNGLFVSPTQFAERCQRLDELLSEAGRNPNEVRRSLMTRCEIGSDEKLEKVFSGTSLTLDELRQQGRIIGSATQIVEQLGKFAEAGVQRVMLQWLDLDDIDGLEQIAHSVLPQVS
jgi:F420-dependent oxidoreductase-like protein